MISIYYFLFNAFEQRCTVIWDDEQNCAIFDPGFNSLEEKTGFFSFIKSRNLNVKGIFLTHAHFDHIYGLKESQEEFDVPIYMNPADKVILENNKFFCKAFGLNTPELPKETKDAQDGDIVVIGKMKFEAIHTPGHTPGGTCWLERDNKILISGDTLFAGSIGRTDNQWGDYDALMNSIIEKLMVLDGDIKVIPGHGPCSSIAKERATNPFLAPFNEPYEN